MHEFPGFGLPARAPRLGSGPAQVLQMPGPAVRGLRDLHGNTDRLAAEAGFKVDYFSRVHPGSLPAQRGADGMVEFLAGQERVDRDGRHVFLRSGSVDDRERSRMVLRCLGPLYLVVVRRQIFGTRAMTTVLPAVAVAFAASCVWLTVRVVNRGESWAKWTLLAVIVYAVYFVTLAAFVEATDGSLHRILGGHR